MKSGPSWKITGIGDRLHKKALYRFADLPSNFNHEVKEESLSCVIVTVTTSNTSDSPQNISKCFRINYLI